MATSDVIKYEDIVDPAAFPTLYENVEKLIALLGDGQKAISKLQIQTKDGLVGKTPQNADQAAEMQKLIAKVKELEKEKQKLRSTEKELMQAQVAGKEAQRQLLADMKTQAQLVSAAPGSYDELEASLKRVTAQWKGLSKEQRENSIIGTELAKTKLDLTNQLKKLDDTTGVHNRSVGNYTHSIIEATKGASGFTGLLASLGKALGYETEALQELVHISKETLKVSRELINIKHGEIEIEKESALSKEANTVATEAQAVVQEEQIIATEGATVAQEELNVAMEANPIGALLVGLVALVAIFEVLAHREVNTTKATQEFSKSAESQKDKIDELLNSLRMLNIEKLENEKRITKTDSAVLRAEAKHYEDRQKLNKEFLKQTEDLNKEFDESKSEINTTEQLLEIERQRNSRLLSLKQNFNTTVKLLDIQRRAEEANIREKYAIDELKALKEFAAQYSDQELENEKMRINAKANVLSLQVQEDNADKKSKIEQIAELSKIENDKNKALAEIDKKEAYRKLQYDNTIAKLNIDDANILTVTLRKNYGEYKDSISGIDTKYKTDKQVSDAKDFDDLLKEMDRQTEELSKKEKKSVEDRVKAVRDSEKSWGDTLKADTTKRYNEGLLSKKEYDAKILEDDIAMQEFIMYNEDKTSKEYIAAEKQKQEDLMKIKELEKKAKQEEIEQSFKVAEDLLKIEKEFQDERSKMRLEAIDHDLEKSKSAIEIQTQLAAAGQANTLAYEVEKQNRLEKERQQELQKQKRIAKEQEALALGLAFLKAYEKELDSGKNPGQALSLAATETVAAKILGKAIAGSAYEGVEDTGAAGNVDSKGGKLWVLHPHEGVVNRENNEKYDGAVGAMNDGRLEDWAMKNIYLPQLNSGLALSDVSSSQQVDNAMNMALLDEIRELKGVIKNRPASQSSLNGLGDTVNKMIRNGIEHTTIKKRSLS